MSSAETTWSVDKEFVEALLRRAEDDPRLEVTSVEVEDAVDKGNNYASVLVRVAVIYTTPSKGVATRSLIVKTPPLGEVMQNFVRDTCFFEKEAHAYETTLPAMRALLGERDVLAPSVLLNDRPKTIVLEDLRPKEFKMADRQERLDLAHSTLALRALATLHAASLALLDKDPAALDAYPETFYCESNRRMLIHHLTGAFVNLAAEIETWVGVERFAGKLRELAPRAVDRMIAVMSSTGAVPRVLNHGDLWTNNMLFHYDAQGHVDQVRMLDFQMARYASPALDIHYFLNTSVQQPLLEQHRDALLVEYHTALTGALRRLGVSVDVSLEGIKVEMDNTVYYALVASVMSALMVADKEAIPDLSVLKEEDVDSNASALDKSRSGKIFRETLVRRLPWFEEHGLFNEEAS